MVVLLHEKMDAAMKHSAREGEKRRSADAQNAGGLRAEVERGDIAAMLISAFVTIVPVVGGLILLIAAIGYFVLLH